MQTTFCDLCKKPVMPQTYAGGLMRTKDVHQIIPVKEEGGGGVIRKKTVQEVWDLCESCQEWIWKIAEEKEKELKKIEESVKKISKPT